MPFRRYWKDAIPASALTFACFLPGCGGESAPAPAAPTPAATAPAAEADGHAKGKGKKKFDDMGIAEKREQRRQEAAAAGKTP